jgi:hypothetical protein
MSRITIFHKNIDAEIKKYLPEIYTAHNNHCYSCVEYENSERYDTCFHDKQIMILKSVVFKDVCFADVTDLQYLFSSSKIKFGSKMDDVFYEAKGNIDISEWDVSDVTTMNGTFAHSTFNFHKSNRVFIPEKSRKVYLFIWDLRFWDVSKVTNFYTTFYDFISNSSFGISYWNVSSAETMRMMFENSTVYDDISNWNVSDVEDMCSMFEKCNFKIPIKFDNWNVSNAETMCRMFQLSRLFNVDWIFNTEGRLNWMINADTELDGMLYGVRSVKTLPNMSARYKVMFEYAEYDPDDSGPE